MTSSKKLKFETDWTYDEKTTRDVKQAEAITHVEIERMYQPMAVKRRNMENLIF
ncbi:MAG TPA: hypothetical protein VLA12_06910 [Planctomycetaceae bacterium]|nr:hypothetical protein [Planctomycetaceae bacterium]